MAYDSELYHEGGSRMQGLSNYPPYTPSTVERELCIMFAFIVFCVLTMVTYWFVWRAVQKKSAAKEAARLEEIVSRARARAEAEKQHIQALHADREGFRNNSFARTWSGSTGTFRRSGKSMSPFGFEDLDENLVV